MICLVNIDVDDIEKGVDFYGSVFGLKVGRRFGSFGAELLGSSAPIYLLVKGEGTAAAETTTQRRTYARHWTPVNLDFVVEDIHSAVAKAVAAVRGWKGRSPRTVGASRRRWRTHLVMGFVSFSFSGRAMTRFPTDKDPPVLGSGPSARSPRSAR